jgi:hypothetical protein
MALFHSTKELTKIPMTVLPSTIEDKGFSSGKLEHQMEYWFRVSNIIGAERISSKRAMENMDRDSE